MHRKLNSLLGKDYPWHYWGYIFSAPKRLQPNCIDKSYNCLTVQTGKYKTKCFLQQRKKERNKISVSMGKALEGDGARGGLE